MAKINPAGNDIDLGVLVPANVVLNKGGQYDAFDNGATVTLPLILATGEIRRKCVQHCVVTLGVITNVTCPAAANLIGFSATKAAGTYLLTILVGVEGAICKLEAID